MRLRVVPVRAFACSAVLAALLATTSCGDPESGDTVRADGAAPTTADPSPSDDAAGDGATGGGVVPGALGEDLDEITEGLSDDEIACIEAADGPVEAVASCVPRALLAEQVLGVLEDSPLFAGASSSELDSFRTCLSQAIEELDDEQIDELAAMEESGMESFGELLGTCMMETSGF